MPTALDHCIRRLKLSPHPRSPLRLLRVAVSTAFHATSESSPSTICQPLLLCDKLSTRAGILTSMFFGSFRRREGVWTDINQVHLPLKINEVFDVFLRDFQIHTSLGTSSANFQVF